MGDKAAERAVFVSRDRCIACGSPSTRPISGGRYSDEPLHSYIAGDPWGEDPLPFLQDSRWELSGCVECGQVFHRFVLDDAWQARKFSKWMGEAAMRESVARRGGASFSYRLQSSLDRVAHVLRLEVLTRPIRGPAPPILLDFGCGFGEFVATAAEAGFDAYGVDWDAHRLRSAQFRAGRLVRDLGELDPEARFHVITLFEVLEHLAQPRELLKSLREKLVPSGILVATVPDCTGIRGIDSRSDYLAVHPLEHINAFEPVSLERFIEREGFERIEAPAAWVTADPLRVFKTAAKRTLQPWRRTTQAYFRLTAASPRRHVD